ncbi:Metallo-dependent phosphatase, partial [Linderina pennispora]
LRILHFNDVYHVAASAKEPVGGAARFGHLMHTLQQSDTPTLTLFSGDAYFPSLESSISRGEHMLPVLNKLKIDAAAFGNHEFDQGIEVLEGLVRRNNFPWVISNLTDKDTGGPAATGSVTHLVKEVGGMRVGIIGIVEKEWLDTLPCLPPTFQYHDFIAEARTMAEKLRDKSDPEMACDLVICLSHMRLPNDIKLADACKDVVDLVLSGHDHFYYLGSGIDSRVIKSGTDFRDLSEITLTLARPGAVSKVDVVRHRVTRQIEEEKEISEMVDKIEAHLSKAMDKVVGFTTTTWDARSTVCRTQESNIGSLSADLMRLCYAETIGVQIGFLCGGAIRSDKVYETGEVKLRDIMEIFPFDDPVVVVRLTGDQIRRALENGVSKWPAQEGRFPQVSGLRFQFDPRRAPGDRVSDTDVDSECGGEEDELLDMSAEYIVATRDYMYQGHDGYEALNEGELLLDEENGISFSNLYRRFFHGL